MLTLVSLIITLLLAFCLAVGLGCGALLYLAALGAGFVAALYALGRAGQTLRRWGAAFADLWREKH